jgi:hypothetical protein
VGEGGGRVKVKRDDLLRHHSVPGTYRVQDVMHNGKVILIDPRGERQRVWPDYVAENFTRVQASAGGGA